MQQLTNEQLLQLRDYLQQRGLTFKPLLEEMIDHASCDLESRIEQGETFEAAWQQWVNDIPENHFKIIQTKTMETINKQFNFSRALSYLSLVLLFGAFIFKTMHLQGATELLLSSFFSIAASLLTSSLSGIHLHKEKKGAVRILAVVGGVIILLMGYAFKLLHLPGANNLILFSALTLIAALVINTLYVHRHASGEGNLLTYLHEKYTPGIERFLLILLLPLLVFKTLTSITGRPDLVATLILIIVIFGACLQFIALLWREMEMTPSKKNNMITLVLICSIVCFVLPIMGENLHLHIRVVLIASFTILAGWLAWKMDDQKKNVSFVVTLMMMIVFSGWAAIQLGYISSTAYRLFFNLPIMLFLIFALFYFRKHSIMRAYVMVQLSSYLFEYPQSIGLF